jgi:hypothetical protein
MLPEYDPGVTLTSMSGNSIVVSLQVPSVPFGAPPPPLDVVLGRLPSGSYTVTVVTRGDTGNTLTTIGSTSFTVAARNLAQFTPQYDYSDLWWTPAESGWGMTLTQHTGGSLFVAWFVYGNDGKPIWYVIPGGTWGGASFSGKVYKTTGPFFGGQFNPTSVTVTQAGTAALNFSDYSHATFSYTVDGVTGQKNIERELF